MTELLVLEQVSLQVGRTALSLIASRGQMVGVFGPAAAGKTRLLDIIAGRSTPAEGTVRASSKMCVAESSQQTRRTTPIALAQRDEESAYDSNRSTEALEATRLWDVRRKPLAQLSPSQLAGCALLQALAGSSDLLVIDGLLDALDPWACGQTLELLRSRCADGAAVVFASNRSELAAQSDCVIVLEAEHVRFIGPPRDLMRSGPRMRYEVYTDLRPGVRALAQPFAVNVSDFDGGLRLEAEAGQELAAKLLLEGYGDVKFVVQRTASLDQALRSSISLPKPTRGSPSAHRPRAS